MLVDDALLSSTDKEEQYSLAYVCAVAAGAGYVVAQRYLDRDGVDVTVEAGGEVRPKLDLQLKATINLKELADGSLRYALKRRNYDLLRGATQTPRLLVLLHLPTAMEDWLTISRSDLTLKNCAYWVNLREAPDSDNAATVTIDVPRSNVFDIDALKALMAQSRTGRIE